MDVFRKCDDGAIIYTKPGKKKSRGNKPDRKIFIKPPQKEWAPTMDFLGALSRLQGEIEDNLYPRNLGFKGRNKVVHFLKDCITKSRWSIEQCCYQHQIRGYENKDGFSLSLGQERQRRLGFTDYGLRVILFLFILIEAFFKKH
jgi:hypothetical protein